MTRARRAGAFALLAFVIAACTAPPVPPASPTPSPAGASPQPTLTGAGPASLDMTAALRAKEIPKADEFDLVRRMQGRDGTPAVPYVPVRDAPPVEEVGSVEEFWVHDFAAKRNVRVEATLRRMTENVKWWVQSSVNVDAEALGRSAAVFQDRIYPTNRRLFGEEWSPGIDSDPRINILIASMPGSAAGYFSGVDSLPRWVHEFSAEREMIYVNSQAARLGTDYFHAVLAHEFCHMQQWNKRTRTAIWFNEGFAQLCERANGYTVGFEQLFLRRPDTQLDAWSDLDDGAGQHYGGAFLFFEYLRQRTGGGYALINSLLGGGIDTFDDLDQVLRSAGHPPAETVLADFAAANALIGTSPPAPYAYPAELGLREPARPTSADRADPDEPLRASVHQQATRYIELPLGGQYQLRFEGATATRILPTEPHSGRSFWWSDRADGMDSTLTREIDLGGVSRATLSFWTWYDIEVDFDYAYVAVSTDGGRRWATLETPATTTEDPNGNNLGHGFTGTSGAGDTPAWTQQRADLSAYAGKRILLRFEYVTDGALNEPGFAVDDIEIPEVGYRDDAESDNAWDAKGFIRSTNVVKQRYVVQVIRFGDRPTVDRHVVEDGRLELSVDARGDARPPVLAVTGLAPRTTETASFEVLVTQGR